MVDLTPVNYLEGLGGLQNLPNPARDSQVAQELQLKAAQIAEQRAQAQQVQQANALEAQRRADFAKFMDHPNPTASDYSNLMLQYPKEREAVKAAFDLRDEAARTSDLRHLSDVYGYIRSGDTQRAAAAWQKRMEADPSPDDEDAMIGDLIRTSPHRARNAIGVMLASIAGPEKFAAAFGNIADAELDQDQWETKKPIAEAEAASAPDYYSNRARKEKADASIAESDAAWRAAKNSSAVSLTNAQIANLRSLIVQRGREARKSKDKVTVAEVMAPIYDKVSKGVPLSTGENVAWMAYTRAPKNVRAAARPRVAGDLPAGVAGSSAPSPSAVDPRSAGPRTAVNPKTGERVQWNGSAWVPVR